MAAKKAAANNDDSNASDFIRAQPVDMTAPEVVEAGRKAGFEFSTSLVYAVRGRMKKSGAAPAPAKRDTSTPSRRGSQSSSPPGGSQLDAQVRVLVDDFVAQLSVLVRRAALEAVRQALGDRG